MAPNVPELPEGLTKKDVEALMTACTVFYPVELLGDDYKGAVVNTWGGWERKSFLNEVTTLTETESIKDADYVLSQWREVAPEKIGVASTLPPDLQKLVEDSEKAATPENRANTVKKFIQKQKEINATKPKIEKTESVVETALKGVGKLKPATSGQKLLFSAIRSAIKFATPSMMAENPEKASALRAIYVGVTNFDNYKTKALAAGISLDHLDRLEEAFNHYSQYANLARIAYASQDVGLSQQQADYIFSSLSTGPRKSFLGDIFSRATNSLIGKPARNFLESKMLQGLATKSAGKAVGIAASSAAVSAGAAAGSVVPVAGNLIGAAVGWVSSKIVGKFMDFIRDHKEVAIAAPLAVIGLAGLVIGSPILVAGGALGTGVALSGGVAPFLSGSAAFFAVLFRGIFGSVFAAIAAPVIATLIGLPLLVALIIFIINSGAYVVPSASIGGRITNIPSGGSLTKCNSTETGSDITQNLAGQILKGSVLYLPNSVSSRQDGICMTPTMIVLHTTGGYDNNQGNNSTYNTLVARDLSCQIATDTDDTILMLSFFEKQVEFAWCADNLNAGGISIEMSGEYQGVPAPITCSNSSSLTFTPNGPHPCPNLEDLSFNAICKVMQQYKIPWSQVFQHEASSGTHIDPVGDEWTDEFILKLKNGCPV